MEYKVTEVIEGVRLHEETPDAHIIAVTQVTIERIIKLSDCPGEAMALYIFYAYTCKWQKNTCAFATAKFVQKHFGWGRDRFQKAKNSLKALGLVEDEQRKDDKGKIIGHYVRVRYASSTTTEIHPVDCPAGGKQTPNTIYSNRDTSNSQSDTIYSHNNGSSLQDLASDDKNSLSKAEQTRRTRKSKATPSRPTNPQVPRYPLPPMEIKCNECDVLYVSADPMRQFCPTCEELIKKQREVEESWEILERDI